MFKLSTSQQLSTNWSGGTTTELFIYPENSSYANRNFLFRISTATVETETSVFTPLPGFRRVLMILKGELSIAHLNRYTKHLKPFDTDTFDGGWKTTAIGKVTDFNIMMASGISGTCKYESSAGKTLVSKTVQDDFYGMYWLLGTATVTCSGEEHVICPGDFLFFQKGEKITLTFDENCDWIDVNLRHIDPLF